MFKRALLVCLQSALPCWAHQVFQSEQVLLQCSPQWGISRFCCEWQRQWMGSAPIPTPGHGAELRGALQLLGPSLTDALTNWGALEAHFILSPLTSRPDPPRQHLFNSRANFSLILGRAVCSLADSGMDGDTALLLLQSHQIHQFLSNRCKSKWRTENCFCFSLCSLVLKQEWFMNCRLEHCGANTCRKVLWVLLLLFLWPRQSWCCPILLKLNSAWTKLTVVLPFLNYYSCIKCHK